MYRCEEEEEKVIYVVVDKRLRRVRGTEKKRRRKKIETERGSPQAGLMVVAFPLIKPHGDQSGW